MKNEAPQLLAALKDMSDTKGSHFGFPARQLFLAIRSFMVDNASHDAAERPFPRDSWDRALEYAQIKDALLLMNAPDADHDPQVAC